MREKQRFAFARVLMQQPDIVVMNEATAALDPPTQDQLMKLLLERLPTATVVSVGHRAELEAFHNGKLVLPHREEGARLVRDEALGWPFRRIARFLSRLFTACRRPRRERHSGTSPLAVHRLPSSARAGSVLALSLLVATCGAPSATPSPALVAWIGANMATWRIAGTSVAVIRDHRIAWARGFGLGDKHTHREVDAQTRFQAASISKALTAVAAVTLFERRGLSLDADVNQVLAALTPHPSVGRWSLPTDFPAVPVTLRMLLAHLGGTNDFRYSGYRYGYDRDPPGPIDPIPTMHDELNGLPPANTPAIAVVREPGVHWVYSPAGYTVIQAVLMDLAGADFQDLMREVLLEPLAMSDSTFTQPTPPDVTARVAVPYLPDGLPVSDGPRVFDTSASGGLTATPSDLARFVIAVQEALDGRESGVVSPRLVSEMMVRQPGTTLPDHCFPSADPSRVACQTSWGLGFDVNLDRYFQHQPDGEPTGDYFGHSGFNTGYLCLVLGSKTGGRGIAVMVNSAPEDMSGDAPQFRFLTELVRQVADEERWP